MKKLLLASTVLAASAGYAAADVDLSGDAQVGVIYDGANFNLHNETYIYVAASGTTDGGLEFGADFTITAMSFADATGAIGATSVYVSGDYGTVTVGPDVSEAYWNIIGGAPDVGYSGLGVDNVFENGANYSNYFASQVNWNATFGDATVAASATTGGLYQVGAKYSFGDYSVGALYDSNGGIFSAAADASFGDIGVGVAASFASTIAYAVDASYATGAWTFSAVYAADGTTTAYGATASYDLGGGAAIAGGVANVGGTTVADLGITMAF